MTHISVRSLVLIAIIGLSACSSVGDKIVDTPADKPVFKRVTYVDLPLWNDDTTNEAWQAWKSSCSVIMKRSPQSILGADPQWGTVADWQRECEASQDYAHNPRAFFETRFSPITVQSSTSLFTGYYEASLAGSPVKTMKYQTPVYGVPDNFVTAKLSDFSNKYDNVTLKGRVIDNKFVPYADRAEIVSAPLDAPIIAYVDDPVGLFFMHIQGSGRIHFEDGRSIHVGYAEQNGHDYVAIGKVLKERGDLTEVSLQTIKQWMADHPDQAQALMNENPSYIFFRQLDEGGNGPIGAQNVALTPMRSIAIDKSKYAYGLPFYIQTEEPRLNRLMIAQDTGGAIKGDVRADIFWGYGPRAEKYSGEMQSKGRYWILLPNKLAENF